MNLPLIANVVAFVVLLLLLARTRHTQWSLAKKYYSVSRWAWSLAWRCTPSMVLITRR